MNVKLFIITILLSHPISQTLTNIKLHNRNIPYITSLPLPSPPKTRELDLDLPDSTQDPETPPLSEDPSEEMIENEEL